MRLIRPKYDGKYVDPLHFVGNGIFHFPLTVLTSP